MPKKATPVVEKFGEGQTMQFDYFKSHSLTVRYNLAGGQRASDSGAALGSVYIYKHAMPDPSNPPKRIFVGVRWED